jgi:hypothetical protein
MFSPANSKLEKLYKVRELQKHVKGKKIYSFDLLAGHTCPYAKDCKSSVIDGKIVDGPHTDFRCYAASLEVIFSNVYKSHARNTELVRGKSKDDIVGVIQANLPHNAGIIRIHSSGDFFNQDYFDSWLEVATKNPNILFYAYTKALPFWVKRLDCIPKNFILTASYGGRKDDLIKQYGLRSVRVVESNYQAKKLGLVVDSDDSHACRPSIAGKDFALVIHGVQPKGTKWAKIIDRMKKRG